MGTVRPQIILFGDSLTEYSSRVVGAVGWGAALADRYSRKADVVFRGFSGYNTTFALYLLDKIFPIPSSNPPLLVTVFFGANDAADPESTLPIQHVPLPEYKQNLHRIISHLKTQAKSTHIVLITPPPVDGEKWHRDLEALTGKQIRVRSRNNAVTKLYAEGCVEVAQKAGVKVIDLWTIFQETPDWQERFLRDGLHFSKEGNAKVFEELVELLDKPGWAPSLNADDLPLDFPHFLDVNPKDIEGSLKTQPRSKPMI